MSRSTSPCNPGRCGSQTRAPITNRDTTKGSPFVDVQGGGTLFGIRTCGGLGPAFAPAYAPAVAPACAWKLWRAGRSHGLAGPDPLPLPSEWERRGESKRAAFIFGRSFGIGRFKGSMRELFRGNLTPALSSLGEERELAALPALRSHGRRTSQTRGEF